MITKNFISAWSKTLSGSGGSSSDLYKIFDQNDSSTINYFLLLNCLGREPYLKDSYIDNKNIGTNTSPVLFKIGTGTTSPSIMDFKLENENTLLTPMQISKVYYLDGKVSFEESSFLYSITKTYKNNTENNITITEAGIFAFEGNGANQSSVKYYCIDREVFNPVIIKPGETYSFSITIK